MSKKNQLFDFCDRQFTLIAAASLNKVIGKQSQLPWHLPADLQHFKDCTIGRTIIMGRKTFESIGKPLPYRKNIILSSKKSNATDGAIYIQSIEQLCEHTDEHEDIMVIGGAQIYQLFMPFAHKILLTEVQTNIDGDTFFPEIDFKTWQEISREVHCRNDKNPYDYAFVALMRIQK